ncbi:transglycosylase domain-containing protein [Herminiimonas sp. CN]|uniref:transglycosylase domain-containing protein n=1 Tax=Herminiimonas sp. CN TaxID=1349818 RepID=UPI0004742C4C|nr:transglycosylase domain-containing protein [Herminiimonas sp. CN]
MREKKSLYFWFKLALAATLLIVIVAAGLLLVQEMRTSTYQARFFAKLAQKMTYALGPGPSPAIRFPQKTPYDERLGYSALPSLIGKLHQRDFEVAQQARISPRMAQLVDDGYFPPYPEKLQSGLTILDCHDTQLFAERYPQRVFASFDELAPTLIDSLLFIENRELLDPRYPKRNPAVEWDRLAMAALNQALHKVSGEGRTPGGSTLATQIEKYRHSPEGRTASIQDKLRQMVSASLRAYRQGEDTTAARRQIVVNYMNTMPLSARPGFGEVHGIGDGLWVWYGRDFADVQRILKAGPSGDPIEQALLYKQALSLLISQRRPSYYFDGKETELEQLTNSYLRLLGNAGVIPPALQDAALKARLNRHAVRADAPALSFVTRKAANTVRNHLAGLLGGSRLYDLDRLDVSVASTLDAPAQAAVTDLLRGLREPANAAAAGLNSKQLLGRGDPAKVVYSFTLYERGPNANLLRVQTDNFDQPLNINEGTKLDLGSTAKLRTLLTYLDIIANLHQRLAPLDAAQLRTQEVDPKDVLTHWAVEYLGSASDKGLDAMLAAALERRYSASPAEGFYTGGGLHHFNNFQHADDSRVLSVRDGLRNSVNLVFIRLMRDVVHHYMFQIPGSTARLLRDADDPRRAEYLARFADREGQVFMRRFLVKYKGKTAQQMEDALLENVRPTASRLSAIFRTIAPEAPVEQFAAFLQSQLPDTGLDAKKLDALYQQYAPQNMSLADRGYLARIHPLELWLVGYLRTHPDASQTQVMQASAQQRQDVYAWLFKTRRKNKQDTRILNLLEGEGFLEVHRQWARLGYPFDTMVPSYASALGASADRPAALAELMGIIVNDGVKKPDARIKSLHFAAATPYETLLQHKPAAAKRVLAPEVAQAVRGALRRVVEDGTAKRVRQAFVRADGSSIPVGGKTGTGDQRFDTFGVHGQLISSRVVNRTATFVFNIDERFFGTIIAYVAGSQAADYDFTSGLPVQLLKVLAPQLLPMINAAPGAAGACLN